MPQTDQQKIIEIRVRYDQAVQGIAKYTQAINQLKTEQQQLKNELKQGTISQQQYSTAMAQTREQIKSYQSNIRALSREYQNSAREQRENEGSLVSLRAQLSKLTATYDQLSREMRQGDFGENMRKQIMEVSQELKDAEAETNRFYRNVGNYESGFRGLNISVQQILREMPNAAMSMNTFFLAISNNIPMLVDEINRLREANKAAAAEGRAGVSIWKALSGAFFSWNTAISVGVTLLTVYGGEIVKWIGSLFQSKEAIDANKTAQEAMHEAMIKGSQSAAQETVSLRTLYMTAQDTTQAMQTRISAVDELQRKYPGYFGNMSQEAILAGKASEAYRQLTDDILATAQARAYENKIAELTEKNIDIQDKIDEQTKYLNDNEKAYNSALKASRTYYGTSTAGVGVYINANKELTDTFEETQEALKDNKAELDANNAAISRMEDRVLKLQEARHRLNNGKNNNNNVVITPNSTSNEDDTTDTEKQQQRELEEQRKAQDLLYDIVLSGYEKRRQLVNTEYDRQIEDIKRNLATEKNLTAGAREAMNEQITLLEKKRNEELGKLSDEQMQKDIENQMLITNNELAAVGDNIEKWRELKLQQIDEEEQLAEIRLRNQIEDETVLNEALLAMQSAYNAERVAINEQANAKIAQQNASFLGISNKQWGSIASMTDAASQALAAFGNENKALTALSKTLALATVAINTGKAISEAIAANAGKPWGFAEIAGIITQILTAMTTATSIINSAKFATGGLVSGPGTGTSDSIPAMLSNGESVMTARATGMFAPLLSTLNQLGGGVPITVGEPTPALGEEFLAAAIAKGMERMPRPVVSVEEINKVSKRVEVIERMGSV